MWLWLALSCAPREVDAALPEPVSVETIDAPPRVHVDRQGRILSLVDGHGEVVHSEPIGIGRGGLLEKTAMSDLVTPTGTFTVDLVLQTSGEHDAVAPEVIARFADEPEFAALLSGEPGLSGLFGNMSGIDFDGDGKPDRAYGEAYVGLRSDTAVTGPKMRRHSKSRTAYWYSIALHGTPVAENLGAANSGGCVHVAPALLDRMINEGILALGSELRIADGPP